MLRVPQVQKLPRVERLWQVQVFTSEFHLLGGLPAKDKSSPCPLVVLFRLHSRWERFPPPPDPSLGLYMRQVVLGYMVPVARVKPLT